MTATHTDARVLVVDERQYTADDGPCLQAMRTRVTVAMTLEQVRRLWPQLAATADGVGVRSFLAVPLRAGENSAGVLNLYSAEDTVPVPDPDLLTVLTEYAGRGLTDYQDHQPRHADQELRRALTDRATVQQAIGILMAVYGFGVQYAKGVLYDQAQDWGRTPSDHAAHIITDHTPPRR